MTEVVNTTTSKIRIDPELQAWIIPLKKEEYEGLEKSILEDGCRDPIVVWKDTIVDGHNRYAICTAHDIPYKTVEKEFETKTLAKIWMGENQLSRRNISLYEKGELILRLKPEYAILSEETKRKTEGAKPKYINVSKPVPNSEPVRIDLNTKTIEASRVETSSATENTKPKSRNENKTLNKLSKKADMSMDTLHKIETIQNKAPDQIKEKIKSGDISIHKAYTDIRQEEKKEERRVELAQKTIAAKELPDTITLHCGDFLKDYTKIEKASVDCIITDPPYVKEWLDNYEAFAIAAEYVLKPGGFLVTYVGQIHLDSVLAQMTKHLDYFWIMMLKHSGNIQAVHGRSVQCGMKPILVFNKPPRTQPKRYFNDVIIGSGREKDSHVWQQGEEELRQIFEPFTDPGDTVLDPFMGSGTTIAMAKKLNRVAIGVDILQENVDIVKGRLSEEG